MLVEFICLREIPNGSLRLVVTASAQDSSHRVVILEFFRPLPDVSDQIHDAEWTSTLRLRINRIRTTHRAALVRNGHGVGIPCVAPRVEASIGSLGRVLPLPLVRQPLPCPGCIGARVFKRNPSDGLVVPACRIGAVAPVTQEIQIVVWMVVGRVEKFLELRVRDWIFVDPERLHVHGMIMKASRRILPGILNVHADIVETLNLNSLHTKAEVTFGNFRHVRR